jgi:signal transduction histidine kinase
MSLNNFRVHPTARLALFYVLLAGLLNVLADAVLTALMPDPARMMIVRWVVLGVTALVLYAAFYFDLRARARAEAERRAAEQWMDNALRLLVEGTAAAIGDDFFRSLARHLAAALHVRYAFVAECADTAQTRVRTLAFWLGADFGENFEYALAGTPCEQVIGGAVCYHPNCLRTLFPNDKDLDPLHAESYLGIPLRDSAGNVIGHLAALDDKPWPDPSRALSILQVFATRAGAELERKRATARRAILHEASRAIDAHLDLEQVCRATHQAVASLMPCDSFMIALCDMARDGNQIHGVYRVNHGQRQPAHLIPAAGTLTGHVIATRQPVYLGDVASAEGMPLQKNCDPNNPSCSLLAVPLRLGQCVIGVMSVQSPLANAYTPDDQQLFGTLANQAAIAIENARLYADLQKALEQEKAARAQLVQSAKLAAMGRMLASVAHEINNPLQVIQNALYLLKKEPGLRPMARDYLHVADAEAGRMADLVGRLRDTYRPATSDDFRPEALNALVEHVHKLIAVHLQHNDVAFLFHADPALPPVWGLRDQLQQALLNLCLNAVEAMPAGGALTLRSEHVGERNEVRLIVHDTGVGIEPGLLAHIFDPFFTTKSGGTGLGLAITHDIVQRHGGRLEVESVVGQGTTFSLWLPATPHPPSPADFQGVLTEVQHVEHSAIIGD